MADFEHILLNILEKRAKNLENGAKCAYKPIFSYSIKNSILPKISLTTFLHSADDLLRNYKWHFRLPMSAFAMAIWNTLSKHQLFTLNFVFQLFHASIAIDNCRNQKYHFVMWMQQGRYWHFGEIEFFGGYENIDPKLHFDICFLCIR